MSEYICIISGILSLLSRIKCKWTRVSAIVAPKRSGKTELIKQLEHKDFILLDLESCIRLEMSNDELSKLSQLEKNFEETSYNAFYYPVCKRYLNKIKKDFKRKSIIVFSSDANLIQYLGISNVLYLSPSNKLFTSILEKVGNDENTKRLLQKSRDSIVSKAGTKLQAFQSYEHLMDMVVDKFGLKPKL